MAKKIIEKFFDDIDGSEMPEPNTVRFGIDGTEFEIDLTGKNEDALRKVLAPYITAGRPVRAERPQGRRGGARGVSRAMTREKSGEIRRWAKSNGLQVSERGRIGENVIRQFEAAH